MATNEIVLGLLLAHPDNSYQLDKRLEEAFPEMQYARGVSNRALRRLAKKRLVRPMGGEGRALAEGAKVDRGTPYEITGSGVRHFKEWIKALIALPVVREELLAKFALCTREDLPAMITVVRTAELHCTAKLSAWNEEMRRKRERAGGDPNDWRNVIVTSGYSSWWDHHIKWLQSLRDAMETELDRYTAQSGATPPSREAR